MKSSKVFIFIFTLLVLPASVHAQTPQEQLAQMVAQLQKTPSDSVLREKIIKLGAEIKPAPAIPEEARRALVRGNAAMTDAKSPEAAARPIQLYEEALTIAPWWGDAYFNLSKARELRQEYDLAIGALRFFLLSAPSEPDARQAQDQIYVLEEKRDRQAKEAKEREVAKQLEERRAAERRSWPQELVKRLQAEYGSTTKNTLRICWPSVGVGLAAKCNDEQAKGSNWRIFENFDFKLSFELAGDEIRAKFAGDARTFCGTVNGPSLSDIRWNWCGGDKSPAEIEFTHTSGKPYVLVVYACDASRICSRDTWVLE